MTWNKKTDNLMTVQLENSNSDLLSARVSNEANTNSSNRPCKFLPCELQHVKINHRNYRGLFLIIKEPTDFYFFLALLLMLPIWMND